MGDQNDFCAGFLRSVVAWVSIAGELRAVEVAREAARGGD